MLRHLQRIYTYICFEIDVLLLIVHTLLLFDMIHEYWILLPHFKLSYWILHILDSLIPKVKDYCMFQSKPRLDACSSYSVLQLLSWLQTYKTRSLDYCMFRTIYGYGCWSLIPWMHLYLYGDMIWLLDKYIHKEKEWKLKEIEPHCDYKVYCLSKYFA